MRKSAGKKQVRFLEFMPLYKEKLMKLVSIGFILLFLSSLNYIYTDIGTQAAISFDSIGMSPNNPDTTDTIYGSVQFDLTGYDECSAEAMIKKPSDSSYSVIDNTLGCGYDQSYTWNLGSASQSGDFYFRVKLYGKNNDDDGGFTFSSKDSDELNTRDTTTNTKTTSVYVEPGPTPPTTPDIEPYTVPGAGQTLRLWADSTDVNNNLDYLELTYYDKTPLETSYQHVSTFHMTPSNNKWYGDISGLEYEYDYKVEIIAVDDTDLVSNTATTTFTVTDDGTAPELKTSSPSGDAYTDKISRFHISARDQESDVQSYSAQHLDIQVYDGSWNWVKDNLDAVSEETDPTDSTYKRFNWDYTFGSGYYDSTVRVRSQITNTDGDTKTSSWYQLLVDDDTNPDVKKPYLASDGDDNEQIIIEVEAKDTSSGIQSVNLKYRVNGGSWKDGGTMSFVEQKADNYLLYSGSPGSFDRYTEIEVYVIVKDNAGNPISSSVSDKITISDGTPPSTPFTMSTQWYSSDKLHVTAEPGDDDTKQDMEAGFASATMEVTYESTSTTYDMTIESYTCMEGTDTCYRFEGDTNSFPSHVSYTVEIVIVDRGGNSASDTVSGTSPDTEYPTFSNIQYSPDNTDTTYAYPDRLDAGDNFVITFDTSDDVGVGAVWLYICVAGSFTGNCDYESYYTEADEKTSRNSNGLWELTADGSNINLIGGNVYFYLKATDDTLNSYYPTGVNDGDVIDGTKILSLQIYDGYKPVVNNFDVPSDLAPGHSTQISANISDSDSGMNTTLERHEFFYRVQMNDGSWDQRSFDPNQVTLSSSGNVYQVSFTVRDLNVDAGNTIEIWGIFFDNRNNNITTKIVSRTLVDKTSPETGSILLNSPSDGKIGNDDNAQFAINVTDDDSSVAFVTLYYMKATSQSGLTTNPGDYTLDGNMTLTSGYYYGTLIKFDRKQYLRVAIYYEDTYGNGDWTYSTDYYIYDQIDPTYDIYTAWKDKKLELKLTPTDEETINDMYNDGDGTASSSVEYSFEGDNNTYTMNMERRIYDENNNLLKNPYFIGTSSEVPTWVEMYVDITVYDEAGNSEFRSITLDTPDTEDPDGYVQSTPVDVYQGDPYEVVVNATDNAGVMTVDLQYCISSSADSCSSFNSVSVTDNESDGLYHLIIPSSEIIDYAYYINFKVIISDGTNSITLLEDDTNLFDQQIGDDYNPTSTLISDPDWIFDNETATIEFSIDDPEEFPGGGASGVKSWEIQYSFNDWSWTYSSGVSSSSAGNYSHTITDNIDGKAELDYVIIVEDNDGNVHQSVEYTIDIRETNPPTIHNIWIEGQNTDNGMPGVGYNSTVKVTIDASDQTGIDEARMEVELVQDDGSTIYPELIMTNVNGTYYSASFELREKMNIGNIYSLALRITDIYGWTTVQDIDYKIVDITKPTSSMQTEPATIDNGFQHPVIDLVDNHDIGGGGIDSVEINDGNWEGANYTTSEHTTDLIRFSVTVPSHLREYNEYIAIKITYHDAYSNTQTDTYNVSVNDFRSPYVETGSIIEYNQLGDVSISVKLSDGGSGINTSSLVSNNEITVRAWGKIHSTSMDLPTNTDELEAGCTYYDSIEESTTSDPYHLDDGSTYDFPCVAGKLGSLDYNPFAASQYEVDPTRENTIIVTWKSSDIQSAFSSLTQNNTLKTIFTWKGDLNINLEVSFQDIVGNTVSNQPYVDGDLRTGDTTPPEFTNVGISPDPTSDQDRFNFTALIGSGSEQDAITGILHWRYYDYFDQSWMSWIQESVEATQYQDPRYYTFNHQIDAPIPYGSVIQYYYVLEDQHDNYRRSNNFTGTVSVDEKPPEVGEITFDESPNNHRYPGYRIIVEENGTELSEASVKAIEPDGYTIDVTDEIKELQVTSTYIRYDIDTSFNNIYDYGEEFILQFKLEDKAGNVRVYNSSKFITQDWIRPEVTRHEFLNEPSNVERPTIYAEFDSSHKRKSTGMVNIQAWYSTDNSTWTQVSSVENNVVSNFRMGATISMPLMPVDTVVYYKIEGLDGGATGYNNQTIIGSYVVTDNFAPSIYNEQLTNGGDSSNTTVSYTIRDYHSNFTTYLEVVDDQGTYEVLPSINGDTYEFSLRPASPDTSVKYTVYAVDADNNTARVSNSYTVDDITAPQVVDTSMQSQYTIGQNYKRTINGSEYISFSQNYTDPVVFVTPVDGQSIYDTVNLNSTGVTISVFNTTGNQTTSTVHITVIEKGQYYIDNQYLEVTDTTGTTYEMIYEYQSKPVVIAEYQNPDNSPEPTELDLGISANTSHVLLNRSDTNPVGLFIIEEASTTQYTTADTNNQTSVGEILDDTENQNYKYYQSTAYNYSRISNVNTTEMRTTKFSGLLGFTRQFIQASVVTNHSINLLVNVIDSSVITNSSLRVSADGGAWNWHNITLIRMDEGEYIYRSTVDYFETNHLQFEFTFVDENGLSTTKYFAIRRL